MEFNKLVFAGLSVGCLAAAAGGSYLAVRQNQASVASAVSGDAGDTSERSPDCTRVTRCTRFTRDGIRRRDLAGAGEAGIRPRRAAAACASASARRAMSSAPAARRALRRRAARRRSRPSTRASTRRPVARSGSRVLRAIGVGSQHVGRMWETRPSVQPSAPEYKEPEPPAPPPPPAPEFVDLTVPSDAVLGLQIERTVSSELARVEDKVDARVTRDVRVSDRIAIPAGSTVRGSVTEVDRGGRMKGKARLAIRFHTIVLADGTQVALKTDPVVREGQSPGGESAAKVGGAAIGGAILGAILGGGKGAAIGGAVGAAGGTAAAMTNDRNPATLAAGTTVTVRMQAPVTVTVQKE